MANVVVAAVRPTRITLDPGDDYVAVWIRPAAATTQAKPPIVISQYDAMF